MKVVIRIGVRDVEGVMCVVCKVMCDVQCAMCMVWVCEHEYVYEHMHICVHVYNRLFCNGHIM